MPILSRTPNYAHFNKTLATHLKTNFGEIGHSITHKTPITLANPGPKPKEDDSRRHPVTNNIIIPNQRRFEQQDPSLEQQAIVDFDLTSLPLSKHWYPEVPHFGHFFCPGGHFSKGAGWSTFFLPNLGKKKSGRANPIFRK